MKKYEIKCNGELFQITSDYSEAYVTAYEYVYGMGGQSLLIEKEDDVIVKITKFEGEGYIDDDEEPDVNITVTLELAK